MPRFRGGTDTAILLADEFHPGKMLRYPIDTTIDGAIVDEDNFIGRRSLIDYRLQGSLEIVLAIKAGDNG